MCLLLAVNDKDDQQRKQLHHLGTPPVSETRAEVFSRCQRSFHLRLHLGAPPGQPSTRWLTVGSEERRNPDYCAWQYDAASNGKTSVKRQSKSCSLATARGTLSLALLPKFGSTYTKIGTIQRRLAWPLRKDDTQNREAFHIKKKRFR